MKIYIPHVILLALLYPLLCLQALAQEERTPYTGNNSIIVALEGVDQRYEFISNQLLVRHNKVRNTLECILPIATLVPLNDTTPSAMAYEVLFGAKYPELFISIAAPVQQASAGLLNPASSNRTTTILLQGVNNETVVPVAILSDKSSYYFSTNFDVMLGNFQASLPIEYLPVLTGRVLFSIDKAYWSSIDQR